METNNIEMITKMVIDAINKNEDKGNGFVVPIGVSARHIHLTQEHVEALFGEGYQLTKKKDLMGGQFASNETVTFTWLRRMPRLRVYMMVMLFPLKLTMSAERSLIRLRSVLMTALHWKCILIQMKQMQQELPQAIQLP